MNASALITIFNKSGPLTKHIELKDGVPVADASFCRMSEGTAQVVRAENAETLAAWIHEADASTALALGTLRDVPIGERVKIVAKARLNGPGAYTRSREHMTFEPKREAWAVADFDRKGMPGEVAERLELMGGFDAAIADLLPQLAKTGQVRRSSTSSGLRNIVTGETYQSGGRHLYLLVRDGADIGRFVRNLFERAWIAGLGWVVVSKCGTLLMRSILDIAVATPEHLIFEGPPTLGPGLEQDHDARSALAFDGDPLDTRKAAPDLDAAKNARLRLMMEKAKAAKAGEAKSVRRRWIEETAPRIAEQSKRPIATVRRELEHSFAGFLFPEFPLVFDETGPGKVGDILADPERFIGATLCDPHEPETQGRNCAIVHWRDDGRLAIFSLAHGGLRYLLTYDYASLLALIERTPAEEIPDVFMQALQVIPNASLSASEEKTANDAARNKAGWPMNEWSKLETRMLGPRAKRAQRRTVKPAKIEERVPVRPWLDRPLNTDELNATLEPIDALLCDVEAFEPPFRNLEGRFAVITEQPLPMTHELAGSEPTPKEQWLPPPPVTRLVEADNFQIHSAIEPHVEFRAETAEGYRSVRLNEFFVAAYAGWKKLSKLPRVEAVLTLPIVRAGRLIGKNGLDREHGVIFRIDEKLVAALPRGPVPLDVARASYEWLRDIWLKDVAFKNANKDCAKALALPLTVIERSLLDARPQYEVTGDTPGGGKSTLINMLVAGVTGHPAPASAWTDDPIERKKNIFAFCLEGAPCVVFDNIKRGTVIDCPHLAKLATAAIINDRVLSESRTADASAKTVVIYNGNRIAVRGDLSSRTLIVDIESTSVDPANREFEHEDPVAWTVDNRVTILKHLFNILMVERKQPNRAKTRFKSWWRLVGHPLELVAAAALRTARTDTSAAPPAGPLALPAPQASPGADFDFEHEISDNIEDDEETIARTRIIERLWREFGKTPSLFLDTEQSKTFAAKDVAKLLPHPDDQNPSDEATQLASDLRTVANRKFAYGPEGVAKVLKNHVTGWIRLADNKEARLATELDRDANQLSFYVERR